MRRTTNLLITSAGSKVLIVQAFMRAARPGGGRVYTSDLAEDYVASRFGDGHLPLPRTSEEETFLDRLLSTCLKKGINLVVPTRDGELALLSRARQRFMEAGVRLLVSPPGGIDRCLDKVEFTRFLEGHGLPVLPALCPDAPGLTFPLFLRPRSGAGGRGMRVVETRAELAKIARLEDYLVNRVVDSRRATEFSVDTLMSLDARPLQAVVRTRDEVVGGESVRSTVVDDPQLEALSLTVAEKLGLVGHVTIQAFRLEDGQIAFIEVNPRFGGASNLSIAAGLDSPARVVAMHGGDIAALLPRPIRIGARMYRYKLDLIEFPQRG